GSGPPARTAGTSWPVASFSNSADVPAVLAAGNGTTWPPRLPRMHRRGPFRPDRGELLRHACQLMPARPRQVSAARRWADAVLGSWDIPGHAGPAAAGLAELAANAVAFGFTATADITLRLWQAPDSTRWLTVAVHDSNPAPPVLRAPASE